MTEYPHFFSLRPEQYEQMQKTIQTQTETIHQLEEQISQIIEKPHVGLRMAWKRKQKEFPESSPRFRRAIRLAYMRGHAWDMTPNIYETLIEQPCYLCGGGNGNGIGLDRINNKQGYSPDNVKPCCGTCNIQRGGKPFTNNNPLKTT